MKQHGTSADPIASAKVRRKPEHGDPRNRLHPKSPVAQVDQDRRHRVPARMMQELSAAQLCRHAPNPSNRTRVASSESREWSKDMSVPGPPCTKANTPQQRKRNDSKVLGRHLVSCLTWFLNHQRIGPKQSQTRPQAKRNGPSDGAVPSFRAPRDRRGEGAPGPRGAECLV